MKSRWVECWVDSTTVLYWIKGQATWTRFVHNRTQAIQDKGYLKWHYVFTCENPSEQGSRGAEPRKLGRLWFEGPNWLGSPDKWPSQPEVCETSEIVVETVKPKVENQMQGSYTTGPSEFQHFSTTFKDHIYKNPEPVIARKTETIQTNQQTM